MNRSARPLAAATEWQNCFSAPQEDETEVSDFGS